MKETTEAITWSTEGKPGDFSPKKEKNNYKEKKLIFSPFSLQVLSK